MIKIITCNKKITTEKFGKAMKIILKTGKKLEKTEKSYKKAEKSCFPRLHITKSVVY